MVNDPRKGDAVLRMLVPRPDLPHAYTRSEVVLGESLGTLGGPDLRDAALGGVTTTPGPQSATFANWDRVPLSASGQKARITRAMGIGVTDAMSGYAPRSAWSFEQSIKSLGAVLGRVRT